MGDVETGLSGYIQVFVRRAWVVAFAAVAGVVLAFVWTGRQTPMYSSSASVLIDQAGALFDPVETGDSVSLAERQVVTEARFLASGIVSAEASRRLGFEAVVRVQEDGLADVLTVTATSHDPVQAQQIAQTYAETYVDLRGQRFVSERAATANQLAERLADIDMQIADATGDDLIQLQSFRTDVIQSLDLLNQTSGLAEGSDVLILDNALLPDAPFTPHTTRNIAVGAVLGLLGGAALALLSKADDLPVESRDTIEAPTPSATNLPVLSGAPLIGRVLEPVKRRFGIGIYGDYGAYVRAVAEGPATKSGLVGRMSGSKRDDVPQIERMHVDEIPRLKPAKPEPRVVTHGVAANDAAATAGRTTPSTPATATGTRPAAGRRSGSPAIDSDKAPTVERPPAKAFATAAAEPESSPESDAVRTDGAPNKMPASASKTSSSGGSDEPKNTSNDESKDTSESGLWADEILRQVELKLAKD